MRRRTLAILMLASMLFLNLGIAEAVHLGHDHHAGKEQSQCQVCYLVKIATLGVALAIAAFVILSGGFETQSLPPVARPVRIGRGDPQSPRAPPLA